MSGRTFFIDLDGTIVPYKSNTDLDNDIKNVALKDYYEPLLPGVENLWKTFALNDNIVLTTARLTTHRQHTLKMLSDHHLRFNHLLMDLPNGPRILINDTPNVLEQKAIAINVYRNSGFPDFGETVDSPRLTHTKNKNLSN